jgi:C4-dicarboxylate-specific signal transduction histidine kinase
LNLLRDVPIQRKLTIISMLTSGLALLVAGLAFVAYEQMAFRGAMLDRLAITASMVADNSAAALTFNDPASAAQTLRTLSADKHIVGAAIYDAHGSEFASYRREGAAGVFKVPTVEGETQRFDGESLKLFHTISLTGERAGTVYIESDLLETHARVRRYALIMVLVMAGASAAAMLLATWLRTSISGPVSHLAHTVSVVTAQKNYAVRAVKQGDDELGRLIDGFNAMLTQIQSQDCALQDAHDELEKRVEERTQELKTEVIEHKRAKEELERVHRQLLEASRQAGMAEIATNVLHNVGNVLNSVNVSATLAADLAQKSKVTSLDRVVALMRAHEQDLGEFITTDPRGRHVPTHLGNLAEHLKAEQATILQELASLRNNIGHIKDIVAMQQNYAKVAGVKEIVAAVDLVEDSLRMNSGALTRHGVEVLREYRSEPLVNVDKHKVLQILVNLVRNAKYACDESETSDKQVTLRVITLNERVCISVSDNGVGIAPENMTRIFNHGFTTRAQGHGFGLHSGALAARELGGTLTVHSDGVGCGASFTLDLPVHAEVVAHA